MDILQARVAIHISKICRTGIYDDGPPKTIGLNPVKGKEVNFNDVFRNRFLIHLYFCILKTKEVNK